MHPPVGGAGDGANEPQQHVGEVDPNGVLHALDVAVTLGVLLDVHVAEQAEEGDPEDEDDEAPGGDRGEAQDEGHRVEDGRQGGEGADHFGVDLGIALLVGRLIHRCMHGLKCAIRPYPDRPSGDSSRLLTIWE